MAKKTLKIYISEVEMLKEALAKQKADNYNTLEARLARLESRIEEVDSRFDDIEVTVNV